MTSGPFFHTQPPPAGDATHTDLFLQATAFSQAIETYIDSPELRKRADLREHAYVPRRRHILTDPAETRKKHAIEMGFNWRTGQLLPAPLEPWTGPRGSERVYNGIMRGTGPARLQDYHGADLASVEWLIEEELAALVPGDAGMVLVPVSDGRAPDQRKYPGAPVPDRRAKIGMQLRDHLRKLVELAVLNLSLGVTAGHVRRKRSGHLHRSDGIQITAAMVATEANKIKARRRDLDGYRWASLSRVREIIREIIARGIVEQISPPRPVRSRRSWMTIPRVIARLTSRPAMDSPP